MHQLPQIKATYEWFFVQWQTEVGKVAAIGDIAAITRMEEKRDIFERGMFVLMFGQFELKVDEVFARTRDNRVANPDWTQRRGWDAEALKGRKVPFETKLSMVLDRNTRSYGKIIATYATRNHCAHGGTTVPVGSIDSLEADLYNWQRELRG